MIDIPTTLEDWNTRGQAYLPGHLSLEFLKVEPDEVLGRFTVDRSHLSWNGFLHAGSVVTLADTCCGYGAVRTLPDGASGFTTVNLSSNFLGTALEGTVLCSAKPQHLGRSTQLWDATVRAEATDKVLAHFRCTQMILWPK